MYKNLIKETKKVINGKAYNPAAAQLLAVYHNEVGIDDPAYYEEALLIKRTGEYYLYGEGEEKSIYASSLPGLGRTEHGGRITPLSVAEAKAWAEKKLDKELYHRIFAGIDEEVDVELHPQVSLLIPMSIYGELKKKREKTGITISAMIIKALRDVGYGSGG